jgi:hypothetical protein
MQDSKPLAFYSQKLNAAQKRYTTGEQELLSIVETLKEFCNILLGQKIIMHTDHKNIVYGNLSNDRIAQWRLLLKEYGPTYVHVKGTDNPQSNGIIERIHQVVGNALRTYKLEAVDRDDDDSNPWSAYLASVAWAVRSTYHTVLNTTLGQLVFGRDIVLPIQFQADWAQIKLKKQKRIDKSNEQENSTRLDQDYQVGDKMTQPRTGPFEIIKVHTNGTVCIRRGNITEQVNIRRIAPYFERSN